MPQLQELDTIPQAKLLGLAFGLLGASASTLAARVWFVRKMNARGGRAAVWAKRVNRGSLLFGGCLASYGVYCAIDNYHSVRALQHRVIQFERDQLTTNLAHNRE